MAKYITELNSVTCGGREHFAMEGVMEIADEFAPFIVDLVACGDLMLAEDASTAASDAPSDETPKARKGRR